MIGTRQADHDLLHSVKRNESQTNCQLHWRLIIRPCSVLSRPEPEASPLLRDLRVDLPSTGITRMSQARPMRSSPMAMNTRSCFLATPKKERANFFGCWNCREIAARLNKYQGIIIWKFTLVIRGESRRTRRPQSPDDRP
jgi:hypothetical protein